MCLGFQLGHRKRRVKWANDLYTSDIDWIAIERELDTEENGTKFLHKIN